SRGRPSRAATVACRAATSRPASRGCPSRAATVTCRAAIVTCRAATSRSRAATVRRAPRPSRAEPLPLARRPRPSVASGYLRPSPELARHHTEVAPHLAGLHRVHLVAVLHVHEDRSRGIGPAAGHDGGASAVEVEPPPCPHGPEPAGDVGE